MAGDAEDAGGGIRHRPLRQRYRRRYNPAALIYGIMRNCQGKHKYARNRIVIPGISEATFSRRKERFLHDIAKYAGLLVKGDTDSA